MIIRLFCPQCGYESIQKNESFTTLDTPVPIVQIAEDGKYEVVCEKGHHATVVLNNLKFELLFEIALNAIIDGYYREAVTSFASSLERFYEFYWRVVMHKSSVADSDITAAWKPLARMSERQIGGYVSASLLLTGHVPKMLNPNKEVPFRNNVVHNGYVPSKDEAISFGNVVMNLINGELAVLREHATDNLEAVYSSLLPKNDQEDSESETEICGSTNILNAVDVRHPPDAAKGDTRVGGVADQFSRILHDREPHRMHFFRSEEDREKYEAKADIERMILAAQSDGSRPGKVLLEIIDSLRKENGQKFSVEEIAVGLGMSRDDLIAVTKQKLAISPEIAIRLAASFTYTTPEFWLSVQANYDIAQTQQTLNTDDIEVFLKST